MYSEPNLLSGQRRTAGIERHSAFQSSARMLTYQMEMCGHTLISDVKCTMAKSRLIV